jgi:hypothetical protein
MSPRNSTKAALVCRGTVWPSTSPDWVLRREQRARAVPGVFEAVPLGAARRQWQHRVEPVERLNRRLLVDREHRHMIGRIHNTIRAWLGHVSIDTTNVYAEVDLETKAQMLSTCGSFTAGDAPKRRWRDDPSLMQFLRSL